MKIESDKIEYFFPKILKLSKKMQTTQPLEELIENSFGEFMSPNESMQFMENALEEWNLFQRYSKKSSLIQILNENQKLITDEPCPICLENDKCDSVLNCSHTYCNDCIFQHTQKNTNCPLCRIPIETITIMSDEPNYVIICNKRNVFVLE
jgi:hypothetical protein